jgi:hypothetical protein
MPAVQAAVCIVVSLLIDRVGDRLLKEMGEFQRVVLIGEIHDCATILSPLLFPEASRLAAPNQNEEPRRRRKPISHLVQDSAAKLDRQSASLEWLGGFTELRVVGGADFAAFQ